MLQSTLKGILTPVLHDINSVGGGGGGGEVVDLSGKQEVWEWDTYNNWVNFGNKEPGQVSNKVEFAAQNTEYDAVGLLNGGIHDGAYVKTGSGGQVNKPHNPSGGSYGTADAMLTLFGVPNGSKKSFGFTCWFYPTTNPAGTVACIFKVGHRWGTGGASDRSGWTIRIVDSAHATTPSQAYFLIHGTDGVGYAVWSGASQQWTLNAWNFVAVSYNSTTDEIAIRLNAGPFQFNTIPVGIKQDTATYYDPTYGVESYKGAYSFDYDFFGRFDQTSLFHAPTDPNAHPINDATANYIYNGGAGLLHSAW